MKNKNGFTLIELLAVIVILAVIALIVTPMVMSTINSAREGAAKSSAYEYIHSVETKLALLAMDAESAKLYGTQTTLYVSKGSLYKDATFATTADGFTDLANHVSNINGTIVVSGVTVLQAGTSLTVTNGGTWRFTYSGSELAGTTTAAQ